MSDVLQDTYYVTAGATRTPTLANVKATASCPNVQTAAGTHDNNITTEDTLYVLGDGLGGAWSGSLSVDWSAVARVGTYAGGISFLRIYFGILATTVLSSNVYGIQPRWGGVNKGVVSLMTLTVPKNLFQDFPFSTGTTPWDHTTLISTSFGYKIQSSGSNSDDGDDINLDCREFWLEVWGPDTRSPSSIVTRL
jgi:hypothetical protein